MYHSDSRDRKPVKRNNQYSFRTLRFVCLFVVFLEGGGGGFEQLLNFCTYRVGAHLRLGA